MAKKISKITVRQAEAALALLFPTVNCTVAPNGVHEIWVKDAEGYGFRLSLSSGAAGLCAVVSKFTGAPPITVTGNKCPDYACIPQTDAVEVTATVYRQDARSQQFKKWYGDESMQTPHPDTYK